jgi:hypothetical protein
MILLLGRLEIIDAGDEGLSSPHFFFWEAGMREGRLLLLILIFFLIGRWGVVFMMCFGQR